MKKEDLVKRDGIRTVENYIQSSDHLSKKRKSEKEKATKHASHKKKIHWFFPDIIIDINEVSQWKKKIYLR